MGFAHLPGEIYDAILSFVPLEDLQRTTYSTLLAVPRAPIAPFHLFHSVHLRDAAKIRLFHNVLHRNQRRLQSQSQNQGHNSIHGQEQEQVQDKAGWVQEIYFESFESDPEVVLNILCMLDKVKKVEVFVGPRNFEPEHLEDVLEVLAGLPPEGGLEWLGLRFRPFVDRATYYQFHKGVYFDSCLDALAKWPRGSLPSLSITQDPIPVDPDPSPSSSSVLSLASAVSARSSNTSSKGTGNGKRSFAHAQPLVFFRLDHALSNLLHSPALSRMHSLKLRIPSRPIARALCAGNMNVNMNLGMGMGAALQSAPATSSASEDDDEERAREGGGGAEREDKEEEEEGGGQGCTSTLKFLDVSTCGLLDTEIDHILEKFQVLQHLVMDRCATMGNGLGPNVGTTPGSSVGLGRGPGVGAGGGRMGSGPARGSASRSGAGGSGSGSEWVSLGRRCALVGVRRAKEREKMIKVVQAHLQAQMQGAGLGLGLGRGNGQGQGQGQGLGQAQAQTQAQGLGQGRNTGRRPPAKPGRKGLSTATISLREESGVDGVNVLASVPVMSSMPPSSSHPSSASHPHTTSTSTSTSTNAFGDTYRLIRSRIRILPPPPSLRSLCLTVPFVSPSEEGSSPGVGEKEYHDFLRKEFSVGWKEGLASLEVIRGRMRRMAATGSSVSNPTGDLAGTGTGTKTMRFVGSATGGVGGGGYSGWLEGLEDLREAEERERETNGVVRDELWDVPVPVLCFAGLEEGELGHGHVNGIKHESGCGHLFSATTGA